MQKVTLLTSLLLANYVVGALIHVCGWQFIRFCRRVGSENIFSGRF